MRKLLLILLTGLLSPATGFTQVVLPPFERNATASDTAHYRPMFPVMAKGSFSVSLMEDNYAAHCSTYHILCYNDGRWRYYIYRNNFRDDNQDPVADKSTLEERPVNRRRCNRAWDRLLDHNLLKMNADAQKVMEKKWANNKIDRFNISHGDHYEFVVSSKDGMRVVYSYSPDKLYEWMPEIRDRGYFIECRDIFLSALR